METTRTHLPDKLKRGATLATHTGHLVTMQPTKHTDAYGDRLYRMRHPSGITSGQLWTRDELDRLGCKLVEREG